MIDILKIIEWLGFLDKVEEKEEKVLVSHVYKDTLKKERKTTEKRDFVNKVDLYKKVKRYQVLQRNKFKGKLKEEDEIEYKYLRDYLILKYVAVAKKLLNHSHFRSYSDEEKEDMAMYALIKGLSVGLEGRSNYGTEYFIRFDTANRDNVFAFWTQVIKIFYYQYLNEHYRESNIKQNVLESMVEQFDYDCKNVHGCPGAKFQLCDGSEQED